jgi:hypothetical protein
VYTISRAGRALWIGAVVLTLACLECTDVLTPFVPTVTNDVDSFEFQVSLTGNTTTARYVWTNTGNGANVNLSSVLTAGTATLTINDAEGTLIYTQALDGSGPSATGAGTSGDWMVVVALTNAVGTVHFTLQKA